MVPQAHRCWLLKWCLRTGPLHGSGKRRKDVTGLDFTHLMARSEGTLAIITKAVLKLLPLPRHSADLLAAFPDPETAIAFVPQI